MGMTDDRNIIRHFIADDQLGVAVVFQDAWESLEQQAQISVIHSTSSRAMLISCAIAAYFSRHVDYLAYMFAGVAVLFLLVVYFGVSVLLKLYIKNTIHTDLNDISRDYLCQKQRNFWVAERDSLIIGCVGADIQHGNKVSIRYLSVACGARNEGIASQLLRELLHWARIKGCKEATLELANFMHDAQRIAQTFRFQLVRRRKYKIPLVEILTYRLPLHS